MKSVDLEKKTKSINSMGFNSLKLENATSYIQAIDNCDDDLNRLVVN
jgi:polysaccharide pyruvyl transferase WcaK-like protein